SELTDMLDFLLPEGPIFRSRSRMGNETVTNSDAACVDLPMAVLVNGNTYSAAEFFAAELREQGVGVIVGERTSGKGYSQQTYALPGGGGMGISTGAYSTGSGVSLIGTGLTLDRELSLTDAQAAQLRAGTLPRGEDPQLQAALELLEE
ncbi:MAG: S41 family peptidase, partial [Pseudoflavonifractor sp.]